MHRSLTGAGDSLLVGGDVSEAGGGISNRMQGRLVYGAKGRTLENGTCEPFVVNCPGLVPAGKTTDALIDFTDLLPTFAELAAARLPSQHVFDGQSFARVLLGASESGPRSWIMSMGGGGGTYDLEGRVINKYQYRDRVVRNKRYKLYVETNRMPVKLVDLQQDPAELKNVLHDPALADVVAELTAIEKSFPSQDGSPRYNALPPQKWDVVQKNPGRISGLKGLPSNDRSQRKRRKNK